MLQIGEDTVGTLDRYAKENHAIPSGQQLSTYLQVPFAMPFDNPTFLHIFAASDKRHLKDIPKFTVVAYITKNGLITHSCDYSNLANKIKINVYTGSIVVILVPFTLLGLLCFVILGFPAGVVYVGSLCLENSVL